MDKKTVLIVEDELKLAEILKVNFERQDYHVLIADNGEKALEIIKKVDLTLLILDLMIPKISGEQVCQEVRKFSRLPIIMLTARSLEENIVDGLKMGADDYITKPFSLKELNARVDTVLRRSEHSIYPLYQTLKFDGELEVDLNQKVVKKNNVIIHLTPNEFKLLIVLLQYPNKVFTRNELVESVFDSDFDGYDRTIDTHVKNLRNKIEDNPKKPMYIQTVFGVGYKFGISK